MPSPAARGHSATEEVLELQRAAGNRAVAALLDSLRAEAAPRTTSASRVPVVQRLNGAQPVSFQGTGARKDDNGCEIWSDHTWMSSTGTHADLADIEQREKVVFNADPRQDMPAYHTPPAGIAVNGPELTKSTGPMDKPGGTDHHSGAGLTTAFQFGPQPNLRKAAWRLIGVQHYQYRQLPGGAWVNLHAQPYVITRKMAQDPTGQWTLTISKKGPGVDVTAGPTRIYDNVTELAMQDVAASRQDQTAEWQAALNDITNLGLGLKKMGTDKVRLPNAAKTRASVRYEYTTPVAPPALTQAAFYKLKKSDLNRVRAEAKSGMALVKNVMDGPNPPTRIVFVLAINTGNVRQQAWWTNENGATYRVLLRADKILNVKEHIPGSVPGQASAAAAALKKKPNDQTKAATRCYARGSAVHEMGHMLHATSNPERFLSSALLAPLPPAQVGVVDPLRSQKEQVATINSQVMAALGAKGYPGRWAYAITNGNPSEVVAEVFAALVEDPASTIATTLPPGLAAVYLAYGGHRSAAIDDKLRRVFPAGIPAVSRPQDVLSLI